MIIYVTVIIGLLVFWLFKSTSRPADFPAGPPRYPLIGTANYMKLPQFDKPSIFQGVRRGAKEFGNIFSLYLGSLPAVVVTDFEDVKELFKKEEVSARSEAAPGHKLRPGWQASVAVDPELNYHRPAGVINTNGRYWREQRRFLLRHLRDFGFGKSNMEDGIIDEVAKFNKYFMKDVGKPVSIANVINLSILNALWFILVGENLEIDDPTATKLVKLTDDLLRLAEGPTSITVNMLPNPNLALLPGLKQLTGLHYVEACFGNVAEFLKKYIEEHKRKLDPENINDFMDLFLVEIQNTKDTTSSFHGWKGESSLLNDYTDLFLAGMETTSSSLHWVFLYLLHYPDVMKRIHAELDEVVGRERPPNLEDKASLHYTNAVLLESFRLTALVPVSIPHYTTTEVKFKNYTIPKNCLVVGSLYHVMHDPRHFKDPETFRPERFLDAQTGIYTPDDRVIPFSVGKRFCLGQSLAEKEFFLFFTGILHQYELHPVPGEKLPNFGVDEVDCRGLLRNAPNYRVIMKNRLA